MDPIASCSSSTAKPEKCCLPEKFVVARHRNCVHKGRTCSDISSSFFPSALSPFRLPRRRVFRSRRRVLFYPVFDASAKCPAYVIPDEIADAARERQQQEAAETAKLIAKGTPVARINTGIDGGMNKVFAAKLPDGNTGLSEGGDSQSLQTLALSRAPGTIPSTVNPPKPNLAQPEEPAAAVATTSSAPPATGSPPLRRLRSRTVSSPALLARSASAATPTRRRRARRRRPSRRWRKPSRSHLWCALRRSRRPSLWKPDRPRLNRR